VDGVVEDSALVDGEAVVEDSELVEGEVVDDSVLVDEEVEVVGDFVALEGPDEVEEPLETEETFAAVLVLLVSAGSCPEASCT
jgi:hypothetical protein